MGDSHSRAKALGLLLLASLLVGTVLTVVAGGEEGRARGSGERAGNPTDPGTHLRFAYLASRGTNRCDLQAEELLRRRGGRLQGSCCSPMDERAYRRQVAGLRRYTRIERIPRDPYDIPVSLAQRLLRYQVAIRLSPAQRAVYRRGMAMSRERGPCCCRCWRWTAFEGLSKYLIARRGWQPHRLARLIQALDGCGGAPDASAGHAQAHR